MTVCIGAIHQETLIMVTDMMLSNEWSSGDELAIKAQRIADRWVAMFAGDLSPVIPILRRVRDDLAPKSVDAKLEDVVKVVCDAFQRRRKSIAEEGILRPYGLSLDGFIQNGRNYFGDSVFDLIRRELEDIRTGLSLLVCGFQGPVPHIFTVEDTKYCRYPCVPEYQTRIGFHAIGAGAINAQGALLSSFPGVDSLPSAIYRVLEAKFLAESAPGVGRETLVLTGTQEGKFALLTDENVRKIKRIWQSKGRPKIPLLAVDKISEALEEAKAKYAQWMERKKAATAGSENTDN